MVLSGTWCPFHFGCASSPRSNLPPSIGWRQGYETLSSTANALRAASSDRRRFRKDQLRAITTELDPLKLLEEMRAVQAHLAALADGDTPPAMTAEAPNLATFMASLYSAWRAGEIRPTFSIEAKLRYLRGLQRMSERRNNIQSASDPRACFGSDFVSILNKHPMTGPIGARIERRLA
jgi:hypothetical protein